MSLPRLIPQLATKRLLQRAMSSVSSQFTVEHEIAAKGFGKGTNDFVSCFESRSVILNLIHVEIV